jgi:hypothetical protein
MEQTIAENAADQAKIAMARAVELAVIFCKFKRKCNPIRRRLQDPWIGGAKRIQAVNPVQRSPFDQRPLSAQRYERIRPSLKRQTDN